MEWDEWGRVVGDDGVYDGLDAVVVVVVGHLWQDLCGYLVGRMQLSHDDQRKMMLVGRTHGP